MAPFSILGKGEKDPIFRRKKGGKKVDSKISHFLPSRRRGRKGGELIHFPYSFRKGEGGLDVSFSLWRKEKKIPKKGERGRLNALSISSEREREGEEGHYQRGEKREAKAVSSLLLF